MLPRRHGRVAASFLYGPKSSPFILMPYLALAITLISPPLKAIASLMGSNLSRAPSDGIFLATRPEPPCIVLGSLIRWDGSFVTFSSILTLPLLDDLLRLSAVTTSSFFGYPHHVPVPVGEAHGYESPLGVELARELGV